MISDRGGIPRFVQGTLLGLSTSTVIQRYPLVRAFLYPPPEDGVAAGADQLVASDSGRKHLCETTV